MGQKATVSDSVTFYVGISVIKDFKKFIGTNYH